MTVVILLLFVLFKLFGKRIKPKSRYIIYAIVMVRLALPFDMSIIPGVFNVELTASEQSIVYEDVSIPDRVIIPSIQKVDIESNLSQEEYVYINSVSEGESGSENGFTVFVKNYLPYLLICLYLFGAAAFLSLSLLAHFVYIQRIKKGRTLGEERVYSIYADVCRKNNITNPPLIWESTVADSPMILGVIVPRIVIPAGLDEDALAGMLEHELKHYTRRDLWVKFICLISRALHWFNPFVHIAAMRCVQEMELSCDAEILSARSLDERRKYGNAMLDIVRKCSSRGMSLTTHFSPRKNAVKERFAGIIDLSNKKQGIWLIVISFVLCVVSGVLISCSINVDTTINLPADVTTDTDIAETTEDTTAQTTSVVTTKEETTAVVTTETEIVTTTSEPVTTEPPVKTPQRVNKYSGSGFSVSEYATSDRSVLYWNIVLDNGQKIILEPESGVSVLPDISEIVSFADVNFDGIKDLLICKGAYGVRENVYYKCYLNNSDKYILCDGFDSIANPTIDEVNKLIYGSPKSGVNKSDKYIYGIFDNSIVLFDTTAEVDEKTYDRIVFQTDFSDAAVLDNFLQYNGKWEIKNGRLWLLGIDSHAGTIEASSAFLVYKGEAAKELVNYTIDVDVYNVQTQTGVLMRSNYHDMNISGSNSFYGYFVFVSKNGRMGAIGIGDKNGGWGGNILVKNAAFRPGFDLHLHAIVSGDMIRCLYSDINTGEVILDIECIYDYWDKGTFGIRMLSYYNGLTSLNNTSFDNLVVTEF